MKPEELKEIDRAGGMLLKKWCDVTGVSVQTTWRWRKDPAKNFLCIWRHGMLFITAETIANFFVDDGSATAGPRSTAPSNSKTD